jgi:hypothetical protein
MRAKDCWAQLYGFLTREAITDAFLYPEERSGATGRHLVRRKTDDSPHIGHPPDSDKPLALRTRSVSGQEFGSMTARPSQ